VHRLQGETGVVSDLAELLGAFHREKLATVLRHQAGARLVRGYDANNVYQYAVNRGEVQLTWVRRALEELGAPEPEPVDEPSRAVPGRGPGADAAVLREDGADAAAFVARWTPRVDAMDHARHRKMLRVILGEMVEQARAFDQSAAGRDDVLGRHNPRNAPPAGEVLATRWVE
jgi:hypothetical protein